MSASVSLFPIPGVAPKRAVNVNTWRQPRRPAPMQQRSATARIGTASAAPTQQHRRNWLSEYAGRMYSAVAT